MKKLSMLFVAMIATMTAWAQKEAAAGNTKVNTDFSKYHTFTWAKSDPTAVGPTGYDIYYYEFNPQDMNRSDDKTVSPSDRTNPSNDRTNPSNDRMRSDKTTPSNDRTSSDRDRMNQSNNRTNPDRTSQSSDRMRSDRTNQSGDSTDYDRTNPSNDRLRTDRTNPSTDSTNSSESWRNSSSDKMKSTDQTNPSSNDNMNDRTNRSDAYGNKPSGYVYSYSVIIPAGNDATNTAIKEGIANELVGRGFRESDESADLIVAYQVFDQRAQLHGYDPNDPVGTAPTQVRDVADTTTFVLEPGTLMVSLIDAKTSTMVWNGFVSGLIDNRTFIADEQDLKEATHKIFEKFNHEADKAKKD
jgi:hypothetical protein